MVLTIRSSSLSAHVDGSIYRLLTHDHPPRDEVAGARRNCSCKFVNRLAFRPSYPDLKGFCAAWRISSDWRKERAKPSVLVASGTRWTSLASEAIRYLPGDDGLLALERSFGTAQWTVTRILHMQSGAAAVSPRVDTFPCATANQACAASSCLGSQPRG